MRRLWLWITRRPKRPDPEITGGWLLWSKMVTSFGIGESAGLTNEKKR